MAIQAGSAFVDRLAPSDRVAVAGFGIGAPATPFTSDRERIKKAIQRMVGQKQAGRSIDVGHNIALVEAQAIDRGDRADARAGAEPRVPDGGELARRPGDVPQPGRDRSALARLRRRPRRRSTMQTLRDLFAGLRLIDAPKTLILISEGFVRQRRSADHRAGHAGRRGAHQPLRAQARQRSCSTSPTRGCRSTRSPIARRDRRGWNCWPARRAARSSTSPAPGETLFERIESEISGYYLLGVESDAKDKDAKTHTVRIDVPRKGAIVRSRRHVINTPADRPRARGARAAAGGRGGARLAAAGIGAAAARRLVRAAGPGARQGPAADSRRRRHRLPGARRSSRSAT